MIFVDVASVSVVAGNGGNGMVGFRREPYVDHGGPDGGDGGRGGNVVLVADRNINTLSKFRHNQLIKAPDGTHGARAKRHGKNGEDLFVPVPIGTVVMQEDTVLADLDADEQQYIIAKGGDGGFGNAHFTSSTRQAPKFAEKGEPGDELSVTLELKMIADVGLVGLPNAGKSTFLSVVSNARPEIADYPFTTLSPNLGVADVGEQSLLIADIPGLIEGASEGKGLGDDFLRHVERTAVLIHLVDVYSNDIAKDFKTIQNELKSYKVDLTNRPMLLAMTKTENIDEDILADQATQLSEAAGHDNIHVISSLTKNGVDELLKSAYTEVEMYRTLEAEEDTDDDQMKVIDLNKQADSWKVEERDGVMVITGRKIEKFARRTDFENEQAVGRLWDIMKKMGVMRELKRRNIENDTVIQFGRHETYRMKY